MCNLFFFLSLYFQNVRGLKSLGAAGMLLPLTGLIVVLSPLAGHVSDRVGRRPLVIAAALDGIPDHHVGEASAG
jgi:MFS family permease